MFLPPYQVNKEQLENQTSTPELILMFSSYMFDDDASTTPKIKNLKIFLYRASKKEIVNKKLPSASHPLMQIIR
jgi:hypothetical protein